MWDNLVIEWAQNNDWMKKRSKKSTKKDKRNFATFALRVKGQAPAPMVGAKSCETHRFDRVLCEPHLP